MSHFDRPSRNWAVGVRIYYTILGQVFLCKNDDIVLYCISYYHRH
jgi:hypothetical protein